MKAGETHTQKRRPLKNTNWNQRSTEGGNERKPVNIKRYSKKLPREITTYRQMKKGETRA